jgi:nucleotide-binding universal stress UspA family protein
MAPDATLDGREVVMNHARQAVVVGVDGSQFSVPVLEWAAQHARDTGAYVRVVTAWQFPDVPGYRPHRVEADLSAAVERLVGDLVEKTLHDVPHDVVVQEGGAVRLLLQESRDAALLVVGARGHDHDDVSRLGSVAGSVLVSAHCPVVVVPVDEPSLD